MASKKSKTWIIIILAIVILALIGMAIAKGNKKPKGISIKVEEAKKRTLRETVSASGRIFPAKEVKISSDVSGEIVELYIMEGDSVKAGQVLAKIDPEAFVSVVQRGEAALSGSKSQLAMSKAQRESSIAQKEQIESQLDNAKKILSRNKQLKTDGILSDAEYETALATVQNLEANIRSAEANIRSGDQSIKSAEFNVQSSEANLKELKTNLSRTIIKAPVSGIVSSLSVEKGERVVGTIQMTGTEMMRIANLSTMEVQVDVSENDIIRVNLNDEVDIEVDAYLDKIFKGRVTEIANSASNASNSMALNTDQVTNFVVKIRMESDSYSNLVTNEAKFPFRPGMSAAVDVYTNEVKDAVSIPIQAVTAREVEDEDDKNKKKDQEFEEIVFVHQADTVATLVVKTGIQNDEFIQILEGVDIGQNVVIGPYAAISNKLKDGSSVNIKEEKKKDDDEDDN